MRVLITGITGYIGSRLAMACAEDHQVFGLVREPIREDCLPKLRSQVTLLPYDNTYPSMCQALAGSRPDLVYHLAAYYTPERSQAVPRLLQSNVVLGGYLLEAMDAMGCRRLVNASTVTECSTGGAFRPLTLYAASKRAFQDLAAYYTNTGRLDMVTLYLSDTYGPDDNRPKVINLLKQAAETGGRMELTAGDQDYDGVYIDDVVRAFQLAGKRLCHGLERGHVRYQVFPKLPGTLREAVQKFQQISGERAEICWGARELPAGAYKKAPRIFPPVPEWQAEVSLEDGLTKIWEESSLVNGQERKL